MLHIIAENISETIIRILIEAKRGCVIAWQIFYDGFFIISPAVMEFLLYLLLFRELLPYWGWQNFQKKILTIKNILNLNYVILPFPRLSLMVAFSILSMPISIRYGLCKFCAIASGSPQLDSTCKGRKRTTSVKLIITLN